METVFADNLRRLTGVHNLKLQEAAKHIGIFHQTIYFWSVGKHSPSPVTLKKVADFFEVDADSLYYLPFPKLVEKETYFPTTYERVEEKLRESNNKGSRSHSKGLR